MMTAIWADGSPLTGLVNNAGANFLAPTESLSPRGYEAVRSTVMDGSFYTSLACGKRLDRRRSARRHHQQSRHLGLDRVGLACRARGNGQGGGARHDHVACRRVGAQGYPRQCDRARPVPDRGAWDKLNPLAETGIGATQADEVPLRQFRKRWRNCAIS